MLLAIVVVAWLLWAVACVLALEADRRQKKRPADAGFSVLPVIPLLPLTFLGSAWLVDSLVPPWGTRVVGGLHLVLVVVHLVGIACEVRRMRSASRPVV